LGPNPTSWRHELASVIKSAVIHAAILRDKVLSRNKPSTKKQREKAVKRWLRDLNKTGAKINLGLDFIGGPPYNLSAISIHPTCKIDRDCSMWLSDEPEAQPELAIGPNVVIGRNVYIGVFKPISIGNSAQIGAYSYIISGNHSYQRRDIPIYQQGHEGREITIGEDVWIGTHVVILPGVTIGKGAIIAAHSLVNKSIPPYEIWGGVPAKYLKTRP
jgi:acetyltransferase-like isoleucine patch superfamily enzyme